MKVLLQRSFCCAFVAAAVASTAHAQPPVPPLPAPAPAVAGQQTISGVVKQSVTQKPVAKADVLIEGTKLQATTDANGQFSIANVPAGTHHLIVAAPGLMPLRVDVTVGTVPPRPFEILLEREVHYTEVVSVSPTARDPFEAYQATSVLSGQQLTQQLESSLGATLERQPGVAERSLGPGPSRPVIRGLDGDRVLILEDGQRVGDLSSQSGDHGVPVNPASASRIEVVRGPATLLYGANAIGGLVNVISENVPTTPVSGTHGAFVLDLGSAAREGAASADLRWGNGRWAVHAGGSGKRNGDFSTPAGRVENTQSRGGFGNLGASWTSQRGFAGASYGYDDTRYGVPVIEGGQVELTPRRHVIAGKAGLSNLTGLVEGFRANYASRRYRHEEIVGGEVGTRFENDTDEFDVLVRHRKAGRFSGTVGAWLLNRDFAAVGEEALSPPVHERAAAAFFYEEVGWPHVTFQFGARVNTVAFDPEEDLPSRRFTDVSGSLGLLYRPEMANDKLTVAVSLARAARNPALEELYFFGPHPGNFAFEAGNASLNSEKALGLDVSLRWRASRVSGEISYFRNSIDEYIFRNPLTEEEFDEKYGHDAHAGEDEGDAHGELAFVEFIAADSVLQGFEGHADFELGKGFTVETGLDYVRGTLRASREPLPRIPPLRVRAGLTYHRDALQTGAEIIAVARQDRVFGAETATAGYGDLRMFASYSFGTDASVHTVTARLDNVTNQLYRNHLSLVKDVVPEMGRNLKLVYSLRF
jgi:iron complex outermembrane receptor protein